LAKRHGGKLAAAVRFIDRVNEAIGRGTSWLLPTMVITTFAVAVLRYGFEVGWIWLQELYVWMHGAIIMIAAGYTLLHDGHVRVDVFYRAATPRAKAWADLLGTLLFLIPTICIVWWVTWPYVFLSWQRLEISREAGGMHGLFLFKTTMLAFCILMLLQGLALAVRSAFVLMNRPDPDVVTDTGQTGM
jgi:TRAP-type mannitol/chloroaromatic compound transport system permease small subunit